MIGYWLSLISHIFVFFWIHIDFMSSYYYFYIFYNFLSILSIVKLFDVCAKRICIFITVEYMKNMRKNVKWMAIPKLCVIILDSISLTIWFFLSFKKNLITTILFVIFICVCLYKFIIIENAHSFNEEVCMYWKFTHTHSCLNLRKPFFYLYA